MPTPFQSVDTRFTLSTEDSSKSFEDVHLHDDLPRSCWESSICGDPGRFELAAWLCLKRPFQLSATFIDDSTYAKPSISSLY